MNCIPRLQKSSEGRSTASRRRDGQGRERTLTSRPYVHSHRNSITMRVGVKEVPLARASSSPIFPQSSTTIPSSQISNNFSALRYHLVLNPGNVAVLSKLLSLPPSVSLLNKAEARTYGSPKHFHRRRKNLGRPVERHQQVVQVVQVVVVQQRAVAIRPRGEAARYRFRCRGHQGCRFSGKSSIGLRNLRREARVRVRGTGDEESIRF